MPPDFLNSREDAILIWTALMLAFAFTKNGRDIARSLWAVAQTLLGKLLILFGLAVAYTTAVLFAASKAGLFHASATKEAVYWFFGVGVVLVGNATHEIPDAYYAKRVVLRRVLKATILADFAVNFYVFPLGVEFFLVFFILLFVLLQAAATSDPKAQVLMPFINGVLLTIGAFSLIWFVVNVAADPGGFLSRDTAERLLVVPALTLASIPLLYLVACYSRYEQQRIRKRLRSA